MSGILKVPRESPRSQWEFRELSGNFQYPTHMLSYDEMNNQPLHLANIVFSSTKMSFVTSFILNYPSNFVNHKMELVNGRLDVVCP